MSKIKDTRSTQDIMFEIEDKYNLPKSWHFLRSAFTLDILYKKWYLNEDKVNKKKTNKNSWKKIFYGFRNIFRKYDYIVFDISNNYRKEFSSDIYTNIFTNEITSNLGNDKTLHFQSLWENYKFKTGDYILSDEFIRAFTYTLTKFYKKKIDDKKFYDLLNKEYGVEFDYSKIYTIVYIRYKIIKLLLKIYRPKAVFISTYTKRAEIIAAKELKIPTIEIQHGVVQIPGYIGRAFNKEYQPDYLLLFGEREKRVIEDTNYIHNHDNIFNVGSLVFDHISNLKRDIFSEYRKEYKRILAFSLQDILIDVSIEFINKVAQLSPDTLIVLVPRMTTVDSYKFEKNIIINKDFICLEVVKNSDWHLTISSSCAFESASMGTKNILWNYNDLSTDSYEEYIKEKPFNFLVNKPEDIKDLFEKDIRLNKSDVINGNKDFFTVGYKDNIKRFTNKLKSDLDI